MRILLDTALNKGLAEYQNMGDVAMLQVAVTRLQKLFPSASIEVLTESPDNLARYCPGAKPIPRTGRDFWIRDQILLGGYQNNFPEWMVSRVSRLTRVLRLKWPSLLKLMVDIRLQLRDRSNVRGDLSDFLEATRNADLLVLCGSGGFADSTREWDLPVLAIVEGAIRRHIPVVMLGQGMGPLNNLEVLSRMKSVLPGVNLITLRGSRGGLQLLESIGLKSSRITTTGDEAIELAYEARPKEIGRGLGINLRVTDYAEVENDLINVISPVLQAFAGRHKAPLIPVPIAFHPCARDHQTIQQLLEGYDNQSDGGLALDTPMKIIKQAGCCRTVVTGAYHAAVFALAQGIPVVCLAKSPYYVAKFWGLEDQFGPGCETIFLDDPDLAKKLDAALERAWRSVETVRLSLQEAARRQIELSWSAYEQVKNMLTFRKPGKHLVLSQKISTYETATWR